MAGSPISSLRDPFAARGALDLLDELPEGYLAVAHDGRLLHANPRALELLGCPADDAGDALRQAGARAAHLHAPVPVRHWQAGEDRWLVGRAVPQSFGGAVLFAESASDEGTAEARGWADTIRAALRDDRFVLHGQPIVDLATGAVVDHELLIRLRGADGGLIAPGAFLPAAERFELMGDIDAWVLEQAVAHAASGRSVHLNVSAQSIGDACVVGALGRALAETGADGRLLTLELTETALVRDGRRAARFALSARAFGCRVALDDFGSGYNGFARIKQLSVDILKIDQLFVRDLLQSPASQSVVKAIVSLARDLGIRTVGEGVEDAATLERLRELGVDQAQGYHLGRPAELPAC